MPAKKIYPDLDMGRESGAEPSRFRASGRHVAVVGAIIDGGESYFDNGVLGGKSKPEQGITFGPEVLRAMQGRRVLALWFTATLDEEGKSGWFGLTVGEMRIDAAKKDGYRDASAFQSKLTDSSRGRVSVFQMKEGERKGLLPLLQARPELWINASRTFRDTVLAAVPEAAAIGASSAASPGATAELPTGAAGGPPPASLRSGGRDVTVLGMLVQDGKAAWDNGLLVGKSAAEAGITFGPEALRAVGGKRAVGVWVSVVRGEDGREGWYGATVGEMRVDPAKKEGFRDVSAWSMKLNDAARGRVDLWRLKPDEKGPVFALLQARADLWESASENLLTAAG
jgi:hypothetical protein